jgi:hypothetical protein
MDDTADTAARYAAYAARIAAVSPSYAAWAASVDPSVLEALLDVPPTKRQPELAFATARALGADPSDPAAFRTLVLEARDRFVTELASATTQANDPRRMAPIVPVIGAVAAGGPIVLVEVGVSAGLTSIPDHVTLDYRTAGGTVRMATAGASVLHLVTDADGDLPDPVAPFRVVRRIGLDPAPIDLSAPGAFDRLTWSIPPEAADRIALMQEAASVSRAQPPERFAGTVERDLDRVLDHAHQAASGVPVVVVTSGTLVYVPGVDRQRFVDRVAQRGVRWVSLERSGSLGGIAATVPPSVDVDAPEAFATIALDGRALGVSDPFGTRITWFRRP